MEVTFNANARTKVLKFVIVELHCSFFIVIFVSIAFIRRWFGLEKTIFFFIISFIFSKKNYKKYVYFLKSKHFFNKKIHQDYNYFS
jgi:hypothetical protein